MTGQLTLYLDDIRHLFIAPEFDMDSHYPREVSGIASIVEYLKPTQLKEPLTTTIFLPSAQITPDLPDRVRAALNTYADQKIVEMNQEIATMRWRGVRGLQIGLGFLAICLLLAGLAGDAVFLPVWLGTFLSEGITIVGWVSLWHPAEMILFEWVPFWRERRFYQYLKSMSIEIKAA